MARRRQSGESNIVCHCVSVRPIHLQGYDFIQSSKVQYTCLSCLLFYMQHDGTGWPLKNTFLPLQKKWHSSLRLSFLFHKLLRCSVKRREGGRGVKRCLLCLPFPLCGLKLCFEGEGCHASHTRRSRETNRARFIKQRELLCRMGNAGC